MSSLSKELSARARALLARDGHDNTFLGTSCRDLELLTLTLWMDGQGNVRIEQNYTGKTLFMESPSGRTIKTSTDNILQRVIDELRQHMVLEDLADV